MTPRQAIVKYCKEYCMNGYTLEVRQCLDDNCPLHKFRQISNKVKGSSIKAIKERCNDCHVEGYARDCTFKNCQLFDYREGHNPKRKGIGNKGANIQASMNAKKP